MMMFDRKKALQTIMKRHRDEVGNVSMTPMQDEVVKDEDGEIDGRHVASQDMISAFHDKSPERLMSAMGNFIDLHMNRGEESDDSED